MAKKTILIFLFLLCLFFGGCGSQEKAPEVTSSPAPIGLDLYGSDRQGALSELLSGICRPFERLLTQVSASGCRTVDYAIPGQMLAQAAAHGDERNILPRDGWYNFTVDLGGEFTYSVWGQDVLEELAAPENEAETDPGTETREPMENVSGDITNNGGGVFAHRYVYDISDDGAYGAIEVWSTLDGGINGHERFDYMIVGEYMYFTDAVLDAVSMTGQEYPYILTEGILTPDKLTLCEYRVTGDTAGVPSCYPELSSLDDTTLLNRTGLTAALSVRDGVLTETVDGRTYSYRLK